MATHGQTSDQSPVDRLAEEFLGRHRRGERPSVAEYVERHPEWADQIREVFPALVMMERLKPTPDELAGGRGGAAPASRRLGDYRIIREVGRGALVSTQRLKSSKPRGCKELLCLLWKSV